MSGTAAKKSSFGWGMRLLPPERRAAMYALYGLSRELDDIADDPALTAEEKLARLDDWRAEIEALYDGRPTRPQSLALLPAVRRFGLERVEIETLIDGMEQDAQGPIVAPTRDELRLYCRRVAGTIGMLSLSIFGRTDAPARAFALALAEALQIVNILRDIDEDAARGRLYLPAEDLTATGVPLDPETALVHPGLAHPGLTQAAEAMAERADALFAEARAHMRQGGTQGLRPARVMMAVYGRLLTRLRRRGWARRDRKVRVGAFERVLIALWHLFVTRP